MRLVTLCAVGAAFGLTAFAAETKVKPSDLPAAVQAALKDQTKGATIVGASQEREHGHMTYEVETKRNGKGRDLTFAENGSLLEVEEEVDLNSIPAPAQEAIEKRAAGDTISKVESVTRGSRTSYEADVKSKTGHNYEIAVNADGSAHPGN